MAISKKERLRVYHKCNGHCGYCGKEITLKQMQVDHMNPIALKGLNLALFEGVIIDKTNYFENLMPSCRRCNHYKRSSTVEQFRSLLKTLHERLHKIYINKVAIDFGVINVTPFDGIFYFEKKH